MEQIEHKDHFHGSDLEKIEKVYGIPKEQITSFSANVNPLGISYALREKLAAHLDVISSYPDRDYTSLRKAIASYAGTKPERVIVGNGSTELISLAIQIKHPKKALILGPTYSEYERDIALCGGRSRYFPLREEDDFELNLSALSAQITEDIDLLIICNPNNPTSSQITSDTMRHILDICLVKGVFVLVDETYVEFAEEMAKVTSVPLTGSYNNLLVLRGVSKFYAAPGLRLGYGICGNPDLLGEIAQRKDPWSVSSLAALAGEIMFSDHEYIEKTRHLIRDERTRILDILRGFTGCKIYPSSANFLLVRILKEGVTAQMLFEACIKKGLMIRNCATFPFLDESYIRFCFMSPEKNDELLAILKEYLA
ncbi:MAG: aminotransferase class I/II-fold pyridoxal phosphate-dependent enzyme [Lachnospiraceae bacterium]|nr:aminotransferase class I/II-fold pyridoxal phosphate-dependent enzyme [Lachnospiraceae bacterium]